MPRTLGELNSGEFSPSHGHSYSQTTVVYARSSRTGHSTSSSSTGSLSLSLTPTIPNVSSNTVTTLPPASPIESILTTDAPVPCEPPSSYAVLTPTQIFDTLVDIAHPYTGVLSLEEGIKADGVSFQPCLTSRSQDRYVVEQLDIPIPGSASSGKGELKTEIWTLTGVFDGTLCCIPLCYDLVSNK